MSDPVQVVTIQQVRAWLDRMRKDPTIGRDVQELQSWKPRALDRVVWVAANSLVNAALEGDT
jgi:hypothetical protein